MKAVVPFYPHYTSTPRGDYLGLPAKITGGEVVPVAGVRSFTVIKKIWGQDVHGHGRGLPFPEMSCLFARKSVYTFHNNFIGQKWYAVIVRRFLFNRYDRIVVQSDWARQNYIRQGIKPEKLAVIPLPIDYEYFSKKHPETNGAGFRKKFGISPGEPFAFTIGTSYHKNPEIIIGACQIAKIKLIIAGYKDKLTAKGVYGGFKIGQAVLDSLVSGRNIIFTGHLDAAGLASAFDASTIYINSSDEDGEAMGSAVYESASAGVPLCVPDYGTFEPFRGCALFHPNHNSEALAENIRKYLSDPQLRKTNSEKAKQIASNFDYSIVRKQYERLYEELGISVETEKSHCDRNRLMSSAVIGIASAAPRNDIIIK